MNELITSHSVSLTYKVLITTQHSYLHNLKKGHYAVQKYYKLWSTIGLKYDLHFAHSP